MTSTKYTWKNPTILTRVLAVFVWLVIANSGITALFYLVAGRAASYTGQELGFTPGQLAAWVLDLFALLLLAGHVVGLFWMRRVNINAHTFGRRMENGPIAAMLWFFVPIASLVKPYEVVREVWDVSGGSEGGRAHGRIVLIWWLLFIGQSFVSLIYSVGNQSSSLNLTPVRVLAELLTIAGGIVFLRMIGRIISMQNARHSSEVFGEAENPSILQLA